MDNILLPLLNCKLFEHIKEEHIPAMLKCLNAKTYSYRKEEFIFREGQTAQYIGVILSGSVQIIKEDFYGNRNILTRLMQSETFGESFACAHTLSIPVNVVASEDCTILFLDCLRIINTCANTCSFHKQIIYNLLRDIATKNIAFQQKIEITSKRTTREKIMAYLNVQSKLHHSNSFSIPYNRQELADYLEVERSAMSAEISKLKKDGIIKCTKSNFTIL